MILQMLGVTEIIGIVIFGLSFVVGFFTGLDYDKAGRSFTDGFVKGLTGTIMTIFGLLIVIAILVLLLGFS